MIIWRNLDPEVVAQLLIRASEIWKSCLATACRNRDGGLPRPRLPPRHARGSGKVGNDGDV